MNKDRNELIGLLAGLIMVVVGLFLFTGKVTVQTDFFSGAFTLGSVRINSGLVIVPFVVGVVMFFFKPEHIASKIVVIFGLLLIVASVIVSTTLMLPRISLYEWLLYIVLFFGGAGLVCRCLFGNKKD